MLGRRAPEEEEEHVMSLGANLIAGPAFLAQIGGIALVVSVWASVFMHKMDLFSAHPVSEDVLASIVVV